MDHTLAPRTPPHGAVPLREAVFGPNPDYLMGRNQFQIWTVTDHIPATPVRRLTALGPGRGWDGRFEAPKAFY